MPKVIKNVVYDYKCDVCGTIMLYKQLKGNIGYEHICNKCGYELILDDIYPKYERSDYEK